jgi:methionyl-tRNA formyltransferase
VAPRAAVEAVERLAKGDDHLESVEAAGTKMFGPGIPFGGEIDWHQSAARIDSFVRALDFGRRVGDEYQHFTPPARAVIGGKSVGIYKAKFGGTMSSYPPGTLTRCDDRVWVQTGRGHLEILDVHVGGRDYRAAECFDADVFAPGDTFDTSHTWSNAAGPGELSHAA